MANKTNKNKGSKPFKISSEDDFDEEVQVTPDEESETEAVSVATAKGNLTISPGKSAAVVETAVPSGPNLVEFSVYEDIEPAPVVGSYRFIDRGITKLEARRNYTMPRHVAEHLADKKKGQIVTL